MRSPDLRWTMGRMTLKCIYTFAVTFSKMEKLVKFLILFLQIRASIVELADKQQAMNI